MAWSILRAFWKEVDNETVAARNKFQYPGAHLDRDLHSRTYWMSVITEEVGKLCRCCNKLSIATDPEVKKQWTNEGYYRIITTVSLLRRLAEHWKDLEDGKQS